MSIEELKQYKDNYYDDIESVAEKLQEQTDNSGEEIKEELTEALYQIRAMAQNDYNYDYWRVLYNILLQYAEMQ